MIPKILHIIWVGDEQRQPRQLIDTWVKHHPEWNVRLWGNEDLVGREWQCQAHIRHWAQRDCAAVADLMRWEILQEQGGVCVAADSVCLRPLDEALLDLNSFACWVSELVEPGLVSSAYVGCAPGNPLMARIIEDIRATPVDADLSISEAVGSARLTASWRAAAYAELTVLPSYTFIPRHPRAPIQRQGGQPYACELWASELGLLDELGSLDADQVAQCLSQSRDVAVEEAVAEGTPTAHPAPASGINIVMLTVRTGQTMRDILETLERSVARHPQVRLTVADGSLDPEKTAWLTQLAARSNADISLIFQQGIVERLQAALALDKGWTLFVSDDDAFTLDYLDAYLQELPSLSPDVAALAPSLYVGTVGGQVLTRQVKPCQQATPEARLAAWQAQDAVQGVLYYSLIRTPIVCEWFEYLAGKTHSPSYSDQLLTALVAARGKISVVPSGSVLVRDESNWATAEAAVASDLRFYPEPDFVLLHEAFWVADLVRMLGLSAYPELAVALKPRALTLLGNLFQMLGARMRQAPGKEALDWAALLASVKSLTLSLAHQQEAGRIVGAFQDIERWATATESKLFSAPSAAPQAPAHARVMSRA